MQDQLRPKPIGRCVCSNAKLVFLLTIRYIPRVVYCVSVCDAGV